MRVAVAADRDASLSAMWDALRGIRANARVVTTTFAYDKDGNLIQSIAGATTTLYSWDWDGRLVRTDVGASGATTTTTYGYDTFGNRVFQTTSSTTTVYPNPFESIVSTVVGSTTYATSTDYINVPQKSGQSLPVAEVFQNLINGTATGTAKTDYVLTDNLGSVVGLMNASGTLDSYQDFYPYGATRVASSTGLFSSSKGFIDQYLDQATNLNYLNARYYSPSQGQFLSEDPVFLALGSPTQLQQSTQQEQNQLLMDPQQLNSYSYGRDNPLTNSDPFGKDIYGGTVSLGAGFGVVAGADIDTDPWGVQFIGGAWGGFAAGIGYQSTYTKGGSLDASGFYTSPSADVTPVIGDSLSSEARLDFSDWKNPKAEPPTPWTETTTFGLDVGVSESVLYKSPTYFQPSTPSESFVAQNYSGSTNISQLSSAVVSYANSPGANLSNSNFAAALRQINFSNAPWLSQSTSVSTPSVAK